MSMYESHCLWHNTCICAYSCQTADTLYITGNILMGRLSKIGEIPFKGI